MHFFFSVALSLLFSKTYRIYKLLDAAEGFRSTTMSHSETVKLALPLVILQTIILLVFTFYDPSSATDVVDSNGSDITHRLICAREGPAFLITMLVYEGGLLVVGCALAFKTRNLQSEFNESKQIILSMYDTAVIATLLLFVGSFALTYQGEQRLLISLGIFWTTCFASFVFVLPRTMSSLEPRQSSLGMDAVTQRVGSRGGTEEVSNHNMSVAEIRRRTLSNKTSQPVAPNTKKLEPSTTVASSFAEGTGR